MLLCHSCHRVFVHMFIARCGQYPITRVSRHSGRVGEPERRMIRVKNSSESAAELARRLMRQDERPGTARLHSGAVPRDRGQLVRSKREEFSDGADREGVDRVGHDVGVTGITLNVRILNG